MIREISLGNLRILEKIQGLLLFELLHFLGEFELPLVDGKLG